MLHIKWSDVESAMPVEAKAYRRHCIAVGKTPPYANSFITMLKVMELFRVNETEALYYLLTAAVPSETAAYILSSLLNNAQQRAKDVLTTQCEALPEKFKAVALKMLNEPTLYDYEVFLCSDMREEDSTLHTLITNYYFACTQSSLFVIKMNVFGHIVITASGRQDAAEAELLARYSHVMDILRCEQKTPGASEKKKRGKRHIIRVYKDDAEGNPFCTAIFSVTPASIDTLMKEATEHVVRHYPPGEYTLSRVEYEPEVESMHTKVTVKKR